MKISGEPVVLYISLSGDDGVEDLADFPKRYGGGAAVPRALKHLPFFYMASSPLSFSSFKDGEDRSRCIPLSEEQRKAIYMGEEVSNIIPGNFDIVFHAHPNIYLNTRAKQVVWSVGFMEEIHQMHQHVLLFAPNYQHPRFNSRPNVYKFTLGIEIPDFKEYKKQNYALIVGNQRKWIQSATIATICNQRNIPCLFAGPIDPEYKDVFLNSIDGKNIKYLGEISHEEKIILNKNARCIMQLHMNHTCATLAAKEALAYGTPVIASRAGEWPDFIKDGVNGYIIDSWEEMIKAYHNCFGINQLDCYKSVSSYSKAVMEKELREILTGINQGL